MKIADKKIVFEIGSKFLNTPNISVNFVGGGSANKNFSIKSKEKEIIIKISLPHKEHRALEDYKKEKWCIQKASKKGVSGPRVLGLGEFQGRAYMVQSFIPGINGKKLKNKLKVFYNLGKYAKLIHSIKTSGFGEKLSDPKGIFSGSWKKYLDYNIKSLSNGDKLIKLKVFDKHQAGKVKEIFQSMKRHRYTFGLNHGDLVAWNTLVEKSGKVRLLDWEYSEAHVVPHYDFINVLRLRYPRSKPKDEEINQFIKGYGMSQKEFNLLKPEIYKLTLLICVDRLRYVIDRKSGPEKLKKYIRSVKKMLKINLI